MSKVYHQNFSDESTPGGCQNPKYFETLKAYITKTIRDKLMKIGMLREQGGVLSDSMKF
jgi:hypothetical protein